MHDLLSLLPPGTPMFVGGLLLLLLPRRRHAASGVTAAGAAAVVLVVLDYLHLLSLPVGTVVTVEALGYTLTPLRVDCLALVWGHVFHLAALVAALFALHVGDRWGGRRQQAAAMMYAGAAIGAVFAGDFATLFLYWELTAITSVVLIWAPEEGNRDRDERTCFRAGMRYLLIQVTSGVVLLAGVLLRLADADAGRVDAENPLSFGALASGDIFEASLATQLIFWAFGIKAAFPLLHNWLQDAYPKATSTGSVFLSAFTTKMAIYALARAFAGVDLLIPLGVAMTAFPIFYAVIVNDLRRVLSYSLNNQLGFMCVGVGIGTELALNGAAAHAFAHILYKSLLFQAVGAVIYRVGTAKATELGGLYRTMPWTTAFCIVGSVSISAFPLTSGFVTKSMIVSAAAEEHLTWVFLALLFASAGVLEHSGIKIPYFAFFAHDSGQRPREAPWHMLLAMGLTATGCLALGFFPGLVYGLLPFEVDYVPYTALHVVTQLQLLLFAAAAFPVLLWLGVYPAEKRAINLDVDWLYRRAAPAVFARLGATVQAGWSRLGDAWGSAARRLRAGLDASVGPQGFFGRTWTVGQITIWSAVMLTVYLVVEFLWSLASV